MKPTDEQVFSWAREAGFNPVSFMGGNLALKRKFAALAYAAGAAAMKERAAKVCADMWCKEPEPGDARDCHDAIRALGDDE